MAKKTKTKNIVLKMGNKLKKYKQYQKTSDNYWLRGLIQAIPSIGSTLDMWFFQFAEKEKQKRINRAITTLNKKLNELNKKLDVKYIEENIEEYAFLFEKFLRYVANDHRQRMREVFAKMMASFVLVKYSSKQNKDIYLTKLSELTPDHLIILNKGIWFMKQKSMPDVEKTKKIREFLKNEFEEKGMDQALFQGIFTDLISKGLVKESYHSTYGGGFYSYHITDLARILIELIE